MTGMKLLKAVRDRDKERFESFLKREMTDLEANIFKWAYNAGVLLAIPCATNNNTD